MAQIQDTSAQDRPVVRRGLKRSTVFLLGTFGIAALALVRYGPALSRWSRAEQSFERARLRFAAVERGTLVRDLSVEGRIVASSYPSLYSPARGTVTLFVTAGEGVEEGQLLARIESPDLESELVQQAASLAALESELSFRRVTNDTTKLRSAQDVDLKSLREQAAVRELERTERSFAEGLVDERTLERTRDEAAIAKLEHEHAVRVAALEQESLDHGLENQLKQVERQRAVVEQSRRRVAELEITSPVPGVIGTLAVDPRDIVIANQELMTVIDLSAFEIAIQVPEAFADEIELGVAAEIIHEGRTWTGMVSSIAPEVANSLVEGRVVFQGEQPATLKQNQRVSTRILLSSKADVLKLRRGPFLESGGGRSCYVVQGELALARPIETGIRSLTEVEILSGLDVGELVVISDTTRFEGAETVLVRE
jgi:HlyD family secretion protein